MSSYDESQERFEEFLRTYKDDQGTLTYWTRVQQMSINDETSLSINFQDLISFDNVFLSLAAEDPTKFFETVNNALIAVLRVEDPDYIISLDTPKVDITKLIKARITNYSEQ
ncbi:MAG: hypothetical protein MUP60_01580, partial [Candidatus Thorarchaeota archaeon]|nr:hypothetical protein [Candidatus Thorarchaeota archaeon]